MTTADTVAEWSHDTLNKIATPELSYVANDAYHWTLIEVSDGKKTGNVRLHKNQFHHFRLEFISPAGTGSEGIDRPPELSGSWTFNSHAVRALRDYCEDRGWTMKITHVSKDGKALQVNLKAI